MKITNRWKLVALMAASLALPARATPAANPPHFCAAIQGNGDAIFGHFHSLAHIVSYYGLFDAAAGSSSATITMFLLESILQNPAITDCNCSADEKAQRVALMLKSFVGFFELSPGRKEATAFYDFVALLKDLQTRGFGKTSDLHVPAQLDEADYRHFATLLGELYNPRFEELFRQSPDKAYHFEDYKQSLGLGLFRVDSPKVFLRPFPVTFKGIATVMGWIGNFYAGRRYDNRAHWEAWFDACKPNTLKDKTWGQIAYSNYDATVIKNKTGKPTACEKGFEVLMADYRLKDKTAHPSDRVDEPVGKYLSTVPITGLVINRGVKKILRAKKAYWNAQREIDLNLNYQTDFRVGYFGTSDLLKVVQGQVDREIEKGEADVKTSKFYPLPGYSWRKVFETSPAEPSISEAIELEPGKIISVGGWADPFPATVLKLAGCENVAFITSERDSYKLLDDVNNLLGGTGSNYVDSSLSRGLKDADAVWCTNWNGISNYMAIENVYALSDATFNAGFESDRPFFLNRAFAKPASRRRYGCNNLKAD